MDQDISVFQALTLWFAGETPGHLTMWGHLLIFWDRLRQVMEFIGALAVVIDLLGAERFCVVAPPIADYTARLLQREHADKWLKLNRPAVADVRVLPRPAVPVTRGG